jgi:ABC-type uncharacterized transport system substrate-binding protein
MQRRSFLTLLGSSAAAWPLAARAQQRPMPVVGFLSTESADASAYLVRAFRQGLNETGYGEGRNVVIEYRWAEGQNDRLPSLAADLVRRDVTVIVTNGVQAGLAAKAATATIPVVFYTGAEPVAAGLVASLNRPGGNLTGVAGLNAELGPKRLELLRELVPAATTIPVLINPTGTEAGAVGRDVQAAARTLGVQLQVVHASSERDFDTVFATLGQIGARASDQRQSIFQYAQYTAWQPDRSSCAAGDLPVSRIRRRWRSDELWKQHYGLAAPGWDLRRTCSQGRETSRPAGAAVHESRTDHKHEDRQGAWHHVPHHAARACGRGDRVSTLMRRREAIMFIGASAAAPPRMSYAQSSERLRRLAILSAGAEGDQFQKAQIANLTEALAKLGWIEGRNLRTEVRFDGGERDRIRAVVTEVVGLAPDVIVVAASTQVTAAMQQQTKTIPIVFTQGGDPVVNGIVQSLARPEGNTTGFSNFEPTIAGKWLELLKEAVPRLSKVALLFNPDLLSSAAGPAYISTIEAGAPSLESLTERFVVQKSQVLKHERKSIYSPTRGIVGDNGVQNASG